MTRKTKKDTIKILGLIAFFIFVFSIGAYFKYGGGAWLIPTANPPNENIDFMVACRIAIFDGSLTPPTTSVEALTLTTARVTWTAAPGMHSYKLSSSQTPGIPYIEIDTFAHPTASYDVPDLTSDGDYYFVTQNSTDGVVWSEYSNEAYIKMPVNPDPPTGLTVTIYSHTALDLSWTAPVNNGGSPIKGYKIERQTSGGAWSTIVADTGNTNTTYRNTSLTENILYGYRVSTLTAGTSTPSSVVSKYTGHCYTTNGDCDSGYTSILGGAQSGCATSGPVNSPYSGETARRYRISVTTASNCGGCLTTAAATRDRRAEQSTDSGGSYSFTGSSYACETSALGSTCRWWSRCCIDGYGGGCHNDWSHCRTTMGTATYYTSSCSVGGSTTCYIVGCLSTCNNVCSANTNCNASRWTNNCTNQSHTIRWCCRS